MSISEPTLPVIGQYSRRSAVTASPHLRVVDLFCGAGGMSEGFRLAGFQSVVGMDCWTPACQTFSAHHDTAVVIEGDIQSVTEDHIRDCLTGVDEIGVLCGGPPCQGFSLAGKYLSDDPRNFLFKHFLRIVELVQPDWVVMENVPSLLRNAEVASALYSDFGRLRLRGSRKYSISHTVLNAANFGVPQTRERFVLIARKVPKASKAQLDLSDLSDPIFSPTPINLFNKPGYVTFDQATFDLPVISAGEGADEMPYTTAPTTDYQRVMRGTLPVAKYLALLGLPCPASTGLIPSAPSVFNHKAQEHSELLVERFANIPPGGSKEDLRLNRPDLLPPEGHPSQGLTYGRLWADRPACTIPANYSRPSGNRSIHPHAARLITPREAMRLCSFPDYYRLTGGMVAQREQVGNSVPPLLAFHIASWLRNQ